MKVHAAVARTFIACGVDTAFGLMGDANMLYLTDFVRDEGGHFVGAVDEGGATSMADGYARATGRVGVASITHGPALTNTVTALVEATRHRSALVLVTGDTRMERGVLQSIDIAAVVAPTGAGYQRSYGAQSVVRDVERAFDRARAERRPMVLNLPAGLLDQETTEQPRSSPPSRRTAVAPDPVALDEALGLIVSAKRPVLLAGRGAVESGAHGELVRLAELLAVPVATTLLAKDYFRGQANNLGICGTLSSPVGASAIAAADCIVVFGASLNRFTTGNGSLFAGKRVVHCDIDPAWVTDSVQVDVSIVGDARAVADAMTSCLADAGVGLGRGRDRQLERDLASETSTEEDSGHDDARGDGHTVDLIVAMRRLDQVLPPERMVVTDAGRFLLAPWRYLHVTDPRHFIHTTNFGSIGLGLATAIGASAGRRDQPTVVVVGDGGFMMSMAEFSTAVRQGLPLVVVVANDGAYGAEYTKLRNTGVDPKYSLNDWPDFVPVAEALGGRGTTVRSLSDLDALAGMISGLQSPLLIDVKLDPAVDVGIGS